jgi:hypothetical protein
MSEYYSLQDIVDQFDQLLEMMAPHEEELYGAIDMISQVRDEVAHLISEKTDDDE